VLFPQLYGKCQGITCKDGARPALPKLVNFLLLCIFNFVTVMYVPFSVFCVLFVCICVLYRCHRVPTQLQFIYIYIYIYIYIIIEYAENNQQNTLNYILLLFKKSEDI
jgi:hypothetical protein